MADQYNDAKLAGLERSTGEVGAVDDLENVHWSNLMLGATGDTQDLLSDYLTTQGFDDAYTWLESLGHTEEHINERWIAYWSAII